MSKLQGSDSIGMAKMACERRLISILRLQNDWSYLKFHVGHTWLGGGAGGSRRIENNSS